MSINKFNSEGYYDPTAYEAMTIIEKEERALRAFRPIVYICSPFAGDIENNVKHCPYIVRCHRAFIVNMLMARHIDNRNRGCNLTLSHYDKPIPVSGTYHEAVKELALFS